ncbi:hypothetical protein ACWET9_22605 [Streptomyces sp. NPDC004059]
MGLFRSTAQTADVTWTDTATGKQRTTEVTVANGGTYEGAGRAVIAGAELGGFRDKDRVQIDSIRPKG